VATPASDLVLFQRRRGLHFPHNLRLSLWIKRVCAAQSVIYQGVHDNAYFLAIEVRAQNPARLPLEGTSTNKIKVNPACGWPAGKP
jgi:hypothetical protein